MSPAEEIPLLYQATSRFRRVAVVVLSLSLLLLGERLEVWRLSVCVGILLLLAGSELADSLDMLSLSWPARWNLAFAIAYISQTCVILVTGGIRSPFLVIYLPIVMLSALSRGWRGFLPLVFAQLATLWGLGIAELVGWFSPGFYPTDGLVPSSWRAVVLWCGLLTTLLIGVGVLGMRITEILRRSDEAALAAERAALTALEVRNDDLLSLTGAVAHELKNPLTAVQSLATLLQKRAVEGSRDAEMLDVMVGELHRVRDSLQEFLDLSRPMDPLQVHPVDLGQLIREVFTSHRALARDAGVTLHAEGEAVTVSGDPRKLRQVLVNLVQNAIEASPPGATVAVRCAIEGTAATVAIRDAGSGVDAAVRDRLFRPGATTKESGTGLGLTISQSIAEQHGGTLALHDAPGGGCVALLTLPLEQP